MCKKSLTNIFVNIIQIIEVNIKFSNGKKLFLLSFQLYSVVSVIIIYSLFF